MIGAAAAAGAIPEKQRGVIAIVITLLVVAIVVFVIIKITQGASGIFEALGFKRDKDEQQLDDTVDTRNEQAQSIGSPWSPQFYKNAQAQGNSVKLVTSAYADQMAKQIWDSVGTFWDTPTQATGAIKTMPTQAALSFLADRFNQKYDRDLWNWLVFKFDTDEQKKQLTDLAHYVERLPKYVP
jgi:hypothetical protein